MRVGRLSLIYMLTSPMKVGGSEISANPLRGWFMCQLYSHYPIIDSVVHRQENGSPTCGLSTQWNTTNHRKEPARPWVGSSVG